MKFGVQLRPTVATVDLRELGRLVEGLGFESLFFPEHTHMPVAVADAPDDDAEWLDTNSRLFDPLIALTAVAAVTERLLLGTGVVLLPQHDTIVVAKQVATLDVISNGRTLFGVGAGWNRTELLHHGVVPDTRFRRMREQVLALRTIWAGEISEFHGAHVDFGLMRQWPKPLQRPWPPVLIGGEGPRVLERVLAYGDGWLPNDYPEVIGRMAELHARCAEQGRDPLPVTVYSVDPDPARVRELAAAGADRCVFTVPNARTGPADIEAALGELRAVIDTARN